MDEYPEDITLLTPAQVSRLLGKSEKTLRNWRSLRTQLPYVHVGRDVRYRLKDVREWLDRNTIPTE